MRTWQVFLLSACHSLVNWLTKANWTWKVVQSSASRHTSCSETLRESSFPTFSDFLAYCVFVDEQCSQRYAGFDSTAECLTAPWRHGKLLRPILWPKPGQSRIAVVIGLGQSVSGSAAFSVIHAVCSITAHHTGSHVWSHGWCCASEHVCVLSSGTKCCVRSHACWYATAGCCRTPGTPQKCSSGEHSLGAWQPSSALLGRAHAGRCSPCFTSGLFLWQWTACCRGIPSTARARGRLLSQRQYACHARLSSDVSPWIQPPGGL